MRWNTFGCAAIAMVVGFGFVGEALATPIAVTLPGTQDTDHWAAFNAALYPGRGSFPGSTIWAQPLESKVPATGPFVGQATGDAVIAKISNLTSGAGPYPASSSVYFFGGGTLAVQDSTPVAGLQTVVLQIDIGPSGQYDFYQNQLPQLNYNGGSQLLQPTLSAVIDQVDTGTTFDPGDGSGPQEIYRNTWILQWDLSSISEPITSFSAVFTAEAHEQLYAVRLDQSSVFSPVVAAVPEPGMAGGLLGAGLLALRRRR